VYLKSGLVDMDFVVNRMAVDYDIFKPLLDTDSSYAEWLLNLTKLIYAFCCVVLTDRRRHSSSLHLMSHFLEDLAMILIAIC
jgi:hypothetical protein